MEPAPLPRACAKAPRLCPRGANVFEAQVRLLLLIGLFQGLPGLTPVRYPSSPNQTITSLCEVVQALRTEMRSLPETCNSFSVPIRNTFNSTALRKIQMQTTLAILAVRFFLWGNPARGGR
jgi:hypothetical protein